MDGLPAIAHGGDRCRAENRFRRGLLGLTMALLMTACSGASSEDDVIARLLEASDGDLASICAGAALSGTAPANDDRSGPGVIITLAELPEGADEPIVEYREAVVAGQQNPEIYHGVHVINFGPGARFDYDEEWGWIAEDYSAIETVVCLADVPMERDSSWRRTCGYKEVTAPFRSAVVTLYQQDLKVSAFVASTGELISSTTLEGAANRTCPGGSGTVRFDRTVEIPRGPAEDQVKSAIARMFGGSGSE